MADSVDEALERLIRTRARPDGVAWLDETIAGVRGGTVDLRVVFPVVARRLGRGGLDDPGAVLTAGEEAVSLAAWRIDDAGRVRLLVATGSLAIARDLYERGDARERTGALRALPFLRGARDDASALPIVLDAMRVAQGEIFEAAILDNPYASWHLPQHEWRKAVLKAIFLGHSILRVARLDERADAELAVSLVEFAEEREAATRAVPPELWPVAALFPPPGLAAKLLGYLEHPSPEHRLGAASALTLMSRGDPRLRPFLADRASREREVAVQAALEAALG